MKKVTVKIWDGINNKFRSTNFKATKINKENVVVNNITYSRNGTKLVGRVSIIEISADKNHMMGHSFPIYAA